MSPPKYEPESNQSRIIMVLCDAINNLADAMPQNDKIVIKMQTLNLPPLAQAIDQDPEGQKQFEKLIRTIYDALKCYYDADKK